MRKKHILIIFLICLVALIGTASAQKMTISELGFTGSQTIQIYSSNGTLQGTWNTSSNGIDLPESDFNLVIKPEAQNESINLRLTSAMAWIGENWYVIVFFFGAAVLLARRW